MRVFQYWTRVEGLVQIAGIPKKVQVSGGSDRSLLEAEADARRRLLLVQHRIDGKASRDDDYEVDICEEVLARLDAHSVITRNRYGAAVLNSSGLLFIDIDQPPWSWRDLFGHSTLEKRKTRIVEHVKQLVRKAPELRGLGVRVYETHAGIRAIVTGRSFDPRADSTDRLLRRFHADPIYRALCRKQGCFRARLTPKPCRLSCNTHKVVFPRTDAAAQAEHAGWVASYERACAGHCTCRLLCSIGHVVRERAIDWHDRDTGASTGHRLA
jgi:hypothetical protein